VPQAGLPAPGGGSQPDAKALDLVTFGEIMVLLCAEPGRPLRSANKFDRSLAGAESNVAIGMARLGHQVGWFGRVGDDALGLGALDTLRPEAFVRGATPVSRRRRPAVHPLRTLASCHGYHACPGT